MTTFRSTRKGNKCFFVMGLRLSDHKVVYSTSHVHQVFFDFARIFSLVFGTSNFWSSRNLIKQLFNSRLLDIRLVIANSALRASCLFTISYPTRAHGIIAKYSPVYPLYTLVYPLYTLVHPSIPYYTLVYPCIP